MKKELELWTFIASDLKRGDSIALLMVAESTGSSPGRQGFKMAVSLDGKHCGSIGGGIMEVKLTELAKSLLHQQNYTAIVKQQVHNKSAPRNQSGMICSGAQTAIIYFLKSTDYPLVKKLLMTIKKQQSVILQFTQTTDIPKFEIISNPAFPLQSQFQMTGENEFILELRVGFQQRLYIFGGGHCALALSEVMSKLDFYICLLDDRPDLDTMSKNRFAHEKQLLSQFDNIDEFIPSGPDVYFVVMTLGYRSDEMVLRQVLKHDFKYLGLLGSKAKVKTLLDSLEQEGYSKAQLSRICTPIGIDINSRTPEEIAISIAAQIIAVKNKL